MMKLVTALVLAELPVLLLAAVLALLLRHQPPVSLLRKPMKWTWKLEKRQLTRPWLSQMTKKIEVQTL